MRLGRKRGGEGRRIDQEEGRRDQPAPKAAKVLIKTSPCTQLGLGAGCETVCESKALQQAVASGGKWLLAYFFFFHLFGKARAAKQAVEDACVLSQHLPAALAAAPAPCLVFCCLGKALSGAKPCLCSAAGEQPARGGAVWGAAGCSAFLPKRTEMSAARLASRASAVPVARRAKQQFFKKQLWERALSPPTWRTPACT